MNAFQLTEFIIQQFAQKEASDGKYLAQMDDRVINRRMNAEKVYGDVLTDPDLDPVPAWFSLDLQEVAAQAGTRKEMQRAVAALMYVWLDDRDSFFPRMGTPAANALVQNRAFASLLAKSIGDKSVTQFFADLHGRQLLRENHEKASAETSARQITTGNWIWETATSPEYEGPSPRELIDLDFTATQLRELANMLDVKLKGNAKSGFLDVILAGLEARSQAMRREPEALLRGLPPEQADVARRLLTARDWQTPAPRATLRALSGLDNRKELLQDRKLTELIEGLRRAALLFPAHLPYYGSVRDSFYRLFPINAGINQLPVMLWDGATREAAAPAQKPSNFLENFDAFLRLAMSDGVDLRPGQTPHIQANSIVWLQGWEHSMDAAEAILNSRKGWYPDLHSGIPINLNSALSNDSRAALQSQTGLSEGEIDFYFALACAMQLIEAPQTSKLRQAAASNRAVVLPPCAVHARARGSAVEEWFAMPDHARLARAWETWHSKLAQVPEAVWALKNGVHLSRRIGAGDFDWAGLGGEFCALRRYVVRVLRGLPAGGAVDWPALRQKLFEFHPACAWHAFTPDTWWFERARGKLKIHDFDDWKISVGAVLERMFGSVMAHFGAAIPEHDKHGNLVSFQISAVGQWLIGSLAEDDFPAQARPGARQVEAVSWLSDERVRLPPAPDRAEHIRFVRQLADPDNEPFTHVITAASLERALKTGLSADDISGEFAKMGAPLPASLRQRILAIAEKSGRIRLYEGQTILQLGDDIILRELMAATSLARHVIYQISPRAVIVAESAIPELIKEMEAKGYTPALKDAHGGRAKGGEK